MEFVTADNPDTTFTTDRVANNSVWGWVWYGAGLPIILMLSALLTWYAKAVPFKAVPMISLTAILYVLLWFNRYKTDEHRSYRAIGLSVFYTTVGFLVILSVLALFRTYYSRSFLVSSYTFIAVWMMLGVYFFGKNHSGYIVIKGGITERFGSIMPAAWTFVSTFPLSKDLSSYDGIVVDLHAHNDPDLLRKLADCSLHGVPIIHAASVLEEYLGKTDLNYIAEEGLHNIKPTGIYRVLKRVGEITLIVLCLPLILTVAIATAVAIKIDSKGPVIFCQERMGKNGEVFTMYKFRSMRHSESTQTRFAEKNDRRITKLGKRIRKFRIDEMPQFWNVLKGDMSLVGPRPEQEVFVKRFNEEISFYAYRHQVRPGITGWAQIKKGYTADVDSTKRKLEYDLYYIKNLSLSLDLLIVYATLKTVFTGSGYR